MNSTFLTLFTFKHWPAFLLSFIPAVCTLVTIIYFQRFASNKLNKIYLLYLGSTFGWQLCDSLCRLSITEETARMFEKLLQPIYIIQFTAWFHCVFLISQRKRIVELSGLIDLLYVITFLMGVASAGGIFAQHFNYSPFWGWVRTFDSFNNIPLLWVIVQIMGTLFLLVLFAIKSRNSAELKFITRGLFFVYAIPVLVACIGEVFLPLFLGISPIPIAATAMITVVIVHSQLIRYKIFNFAETMNAENVAEIIQETIFVVSQKRSITYINRYGRELVAEGADIKKLTDLFGSNTIHYKEFEQQVISPAFEKAQAGRFRFSMEIKEKHIHWDTTTYPILSGKKIGGLLVMCRDISHQVLMAESKLVALRSQMNPHFIFNSLNAIQHYIHANQKELAENFLSTFAKLIRKILDHSASSFILVSDELQTIEFYLTLEKARFGNRLSFEINVDENLDTDNALIPNLLVQPYIENAILHGISSKQNGGLIVVSFTMKKDFIICRVTDNGVGRQKAAEIKKRKLIENKSYGMSITKARLELLNQQLNIPVSVTIDDLYEENGTACGTRIEICMPLQNRY